MEIKVIRTQFGKDATNGMVFIDGLFECYSLEDQYQEVKVMHETCIPEGKYDIKFRTTGGFHSKYSSRYGAMHHGMLHIQDVPGFQYILIHTGNTDEHTSGCLIVGDTQQDLDVNFNGMVGASTQAYKKLYPKIAKELLIGEKVTIEYSRINLSNKELSNVSPPDYMNPNDVKEKLEEISGEIQILNAKLDGKRIT